MACTRRFYCVSFLKQLVSYCSFYDFKVGWGRTELITLLCPFPSDMIKVATTYISPSSVGYPKFPTVTTLTTLKLSSPSHMLHFSWLLLFITNCWNVYFTWTDLSQKNLDKCENMHTMLFWARCNSSFFLHSSVVYIVLVYFKQAEF